MGNLVVKRKWNTVVFTNDEGAMTSRVCTKCNKLKVNEAFGKNGHNEFGKRSECRGCHNDMQYKTLYIRKHKSRAKKHGLPSTMTNELREKAKQEQGFKCILTGRTDDLVTDHHIPLSWGTGFGDTYGNVVLMTRGLNSSKRDKNPFQWIQTQPKEYQERFYNILVPMMAERNGMTNKEYEAYVNECYKTRGTN